MDTKFKLYVSCIHQEKERFQQIAEEENLKKRFSKILHELGYKFVIYDETQTPNLKEVMTE